MPRDGVLILSDIRNSTLSIICEPCSRRGTYNVASIHDRCKAVFGQRLPRVNPQLARSVFDRRAHWWIA
jgi:hypothetical protein